MTWLKSCRIVSDKVDDIREPWKTVLTVEFRSDRVPADLGSDAPPRIGRAALAQFEKELDEDEH